MVSSGFYPTDRCYLRQARVFIPLIDVMEGLAFTPTDRISVRMGGGCSYWMEVHYGKDGDYTDC